MPTVHQRYGRTDGRTTYDSILRLHYVHRAVKTRTALNLKVEIK